MAKKYIDAEKLKAEIERRIDKHWEALPDADSPEDDWTRNELCELGAYKELEHIEDFLNSLQQEQPEVDLEKEINIEISKWTCYEEIGFGARYDAKPFDSRDIEKIARHFYNLGLNARKEE